MRGLRRNARSGVWTRGKARRAGAQAPAVLLALWLLLPAGWPTAAAAAGADHRAAPGSEPRRLLVQLRDTPPNDRPSFNRGSDRSYTVSTGGSGDRDDALPPGVPDNGSVVSTSNSTRQLRVGAGERVRVDLPVVQSLQFHVAAGGAPDKVFAPGTKGPNAGPSGAVTPGGAEGGDPVRGRVRVPASGVVYFEAVSAFAARFAISGSRVWIELVPLRAGSVQAPAVPGEAGAIVIQGAVGEWIALGDADVALGAKSLQPIASAPAPACLWVRVYPDGGPAAEAGRVR